MASRNKGTFSKEIEDNGLDKGMDYAILDEFVRVLKKINVYIFLLMEKILEI